MIGSRIGDWPEGLTPSHVKALIGAGYNPLNYDGWLLDWYVNGAPATSACAGAAPKPLPLPTRKDQAAHGAANPTPGAGERDSEPDLAGRIAEARERLARARAAASDDNERIGHTLP